MKKYFLISLWGLLAYSPLVFSNKKECLKVFSESNSHRENAFDLLKIEDELSQALSSGHFKKNQYLINLLRYKLSGIPEDVIQASQAVWQVRFGHQNMPTSAGSGFFIAPDLFVTNYHVIKEAIHSTKKTDRIHLAHPSFSKIIKVKEILDFSFSSYTDFALLKTKTKAPYYLQLREDALIDEKEEFFMAGYPQGDGSRKFFIMKKKGVHIVNLDLTLALDLNVSPPALLDLSVKPSEFFFMNGGSGSPILDNQGLVVGIVHSAYNYPNNNVISSKPLSLLKPFIYKNTANIKEEDYLEDLRHLLFSYEGQGSSFALEQILNYTETSKEDIQESPRIHLPESNLKRGDMKAQYELGLRYYLGIKVEQNTLKGYQLLKEIKKLKEKNQLTKKQLYIIDRLIKQTRKHAIKKTFNQVLRAYSAEITNKLKKNRSPY